jgi:N-formylglutamate amidohydrolase
MALHPGAKSRAGLGLLPRRLSAAGELWRGRVTWAEAEARIADYHRPYHAALTTMVARAKAVFGQVLLIDLHSMPPLMAGTVYGPRPPQIVLGDRFGRSASARLTGAATAVFESPGLAVTQNHPYSGNHLLDRHGAPARGIHALQIEIDRRLYLDGALDAPGNGLESMQAHLAELAATLADELDPRRHALAAE